MAVRYSRGRLKYMGRTARPAFRAWTESAHGRAALEQVASRLRFAPFGRMRAARRRIWRQLARATRSEPVRAALQREVDTYLSRLETLVFARNLPRVSVDLHRLVVVPRVFVNAEAYRHMDDALRALPQFAAIDGGESLRRGFILTLIDDIAAAIAGARPTAKRPMPAGDGWITVGADEQFEWRIPIDDGPAWPGHYFVLELAPRPMTRAVRRAARDAIPRVETSLRSLSRAHRVEILREASSSLDELFGRRPLTYTRSASA